MTKIKSFFKSDSPKDRLIRKIVVIIILTIVIGFSIGFLCGSSLGYATTASPIDGSKVHVVEYNPDDNHIKMIIDHMKGN